MNPEEKSIPIALCVFLSSFVKHKLSLSLTEASASQQFALNGSIKGSESDFGERIFLPLRYLIFLRNGVNVSLR